MYKSNIRHINTYRSMQFAEFALQHAVDSIYWVMPDASFFYVNDAACVMSGYTQEELLSLHVYDLDPNVTSKNWPERWNQIRNDKYQHAESQLRTKDGRLLEIEVRSNYLQFEGGEYNCAIVRDITERKRIEKVLRENEERLNLISALTSDYTYSLVVTPDGSSVIEWISNAFTKVTGYIVEEIRTPDRWGKIIHPDDRALVRNYFEQYLAGQTTQPLEFRIIQKDGSVKWLRNYMQSLCDDQGCVNRIVGAAQDITERRQVEEKLRLDSAMLANMVEGVVLVGASNGTIIYSNHLFESMFGYSPGELTGKHVSILNAPADKSPEDTALEIITAMHERNVWSGEIRNIRKDGTVFWTFANIAKFEHSSYGVVWVANQHDITARKESVLALKDSEGKYRSLVEHSPYCIHEINLEGQIISMNRAGLKMADKDQEQEQEIIGVDYLSAVSMADRPRIKELLESAMRGITNEFEFTSINGKYFQSSFVPICLDDRRVQRIMGITVDVTERKQAEKELDSAVSLLRATLESTADGILVVDGKGRILDYNQRFVDLWKIPADILETRDDNLALDYVLDQLCEPDLFLNRVLELYNNPEVIDSNLIEFKDGRIFERYSKPQLLGNELVGRVISFRDITYRQQTEEKLIKAQNMLQSVLDTIPVRVFWKDTESRFLGCNTNFARDAGLNVSDDIIGKNDFELPWVTQAETYRADDREIIRQDKPKLGYEEPQTRPDGSMVWLKTNKIPMKDKHGKIIGILGTYEDITETKKIEQALRESEEKFYKAFNSSPDSMVINRLSDGRLINVNEAFEKIIGYSRVEAVDKTPVELRIWVQPEERRRYIDILKKHGRLRDFEVTIRRKDGEIRIHRLSAETFVLNGESCIVSIGVDITDHKNEQIRFQRSLRAFRVLSSCNEAVTRVTDEQQLLQIVCRIAVEQGGYRFSWVGYPQTDAVKTVLPVAYAGYEAGYLSNLITWAADDKRGRGPTGKSLRSEKNVVVRDIANDPIFQPWQKPALEHGYASSVALPLVAGPDLIGALMIYASEVNAFDDDEVKLLTELADNLAMGVHNLRIAKSLEKIRQDADQQYHELDLLYNTAPIGFALLDTELRFVRVNKVLADAHQLSVEDHYGRTISDIKPEFAPVLEPVFRKILATGEPVLGWEIHEQLSGSGGDRYWLGYFVPLKIDSGEIIGINLMLQNISERKRTEELLSLEKNVYELITSEQSLFRTLESICTSIEKLIPDSLCSILLLDAEHKRLFHGVAPSMAKTYIRAIDGLTIGPDVGSCGSAAFRNERVIVADITTDPLWSEFKNLAVAHGLQACWSTPIRSSKKDVLGTFAIYFHTSRSPEGTELDTIDRMSHLAGIAIERDKAEASLRLQDRALASAVDSIMISDACQEDNPIVYCNTAFERMTGYTREEVLGRNPRFLQKDDRNQHALKSIRQALKSGKETCTVLRNYRKDGTLFWNELHLAPVKDGDGRITHWIGVHNDITSQKIAEKALVESEDKFSKAFSSLPDPLIISRIVDGTIVDVNDSCVEVSGYSRDELIGRNIFDLEIWANSDQSRMVVNNMLNHGKITDIEADFVKKSGETARILVSAEIIQIKNTPHMLLLARDITLQQRTQDALQRSERLLRFLYEENPSMYFTITPHGMIKAVNTFGAKSLGYTIEELRDKSVFMLFKNGDRGIVQDQLVTCLTNPGITFEWEIRKICKDGSLIWVKETAVAVKSPEGEMVILVVCRDITSRKQAETELEERAEQQNFIAELGKLAIAETELEIIFKTAVAGLSKILDVEYAKILQLSPDGKELLLRTGVGWKPGLVGSATVSAGCDTQAGYTLLQKRAVIVKDLRKETRFNGTQILFDHRIISGISTVIQGTDRPFGVLGAFTTVYRDFSQNSIDFLHSIAYVLAESINRTQARNIILQSRENLRDLTQRLQQVREEERTKISREIHDDLGQRLTSLKLDLSWINRHMPKDNNKLSERLDAVISLTDSTLDVTRKIALELRPAILDDLGLLPAIEWEVQRFSQRTNCSYTLNLQDVTPNLDRDLMITIFRILQEALTNITRHAHATHVDISLKCDERILKLVISDNGIGIKTENLSRTDSLGLVSMRERVGACHGRVKIENGEDGGTIVTMVIPLKSIQP